MQVKSVLVPNMWYFIYALTPSGGIRVVSHFLLFSNVFTLFIFWIFNCQCINKIISPIMISLSVGCFHFLKLCSLWNKKKSRHSKTVSAAFLTSSVSVSCVQTGGDRERMTANHETYLLMASTQNDMEDWVKTIRRVIWAPFGGG